jgi:adenylate cyclase
MPPQPWVRHDAMTERPFAPKDFPMVRDPQKVRLENMFVPAAKSRSVALGPGGHYFMVLGASSADDAARRSWNRAARIAGVACLVVASTTISSCRSRPCSGSPASSMPLPTLRSPRTRVAMSCASSPMHGLERQSPSAPRAVRASA